MKYVDVLLDEGIDKPLEYAVEDTIQPTLGMRVRVPLRSREVEGWILREKTGPESSNPLPITALLYEAPLFDEELFKLYQFVSRYYCTPLQKVLRIAIPKGVKENVVTRKFGLYQLTEEGKEGEGRSPKQKEILERLSAGDLTDAEMKERGWLPSHFRPLIEKGFVKRIEGERPFSPLEEADYFATKPKKLSVEQEKTFIALQEALEKGGFSPHLLFGVTGSGKTEVYIRLMERALEMGKGVLFLVPEVALTTQILERLKSRFNEGLSVLHHRLSHGERNAGWQALLNGKARIVIGARSTLFSPIQNLGLIIVDEEHEGAYKQNEDAPCYNARDLALLRGKSAGALVLLGSATPSLESFTHAQEGKYGLHVLKERPTTKPLPKVTVVDMVREDEKHGGFCLLSDRLIEGIKERLENGEQSILFLNRRGHHTSLFCSQCQEALHCDHCTIPLVFHKHEQQLHCHGCGVAKMPPRECPTCKSPLLVYRGYGTERVESVLHALFPDARILRMDKDTTKNKGSHETILRAFASGKGDILIGTQMVAKGLNFPQVTLVGILNADQNLHLPDFRAGESTFQILTQVSGRAGRGDVEGEVILQTHLKDHPVLKHVLAHAYEPFFEEEKEGRKLLQFPPFARLAKMIFRGPDENEVRKTGEMVREELVKNLPASFTLYPVVPCGRERVRDEYYYQCLLKASSMKPLQDWIARGQLKPFQKKREVLIKVDVDPLSLF